MRSKALALATIMIATTGLSFGQPAPDQASPTQSDANLQHHREQEVLVPSGSFPDAIARVKQAGLMKPAANGNFYANRPLSRAELASILVRTFKLKAREATAAQPVSPSDVPHSYWASDDIKTVLDRNIMEGYRDNRFFPQHPVTRGEALAIFAQAYGVQQYDDTTVAAVLARYPDASEIQPWARKSLATSLKNGFVDIAPPDKIRPLQPMTRGAMAYVLDQYLKRLDQSEQQTLH